MNKIKIEASYILKNKTGIGMYVDTLTEIFGKRGIEYSFETLNLNLPYRYIWQTLWLNTVVYVKTLIQKPDIFIFPNFIMPYFKVKGTKYITVIYDLCHLRKGEMKKYNAFIFNLSAEIAVRKADVIVTDSNTVKGELIAKYGLNPDKIKVVYNALGKHFENTKNETEVLNKYNIEKDKYILSVATLNKRKNIPELIKAFELISDKYPDLKLVLVGGAGNANREAFSKHPNVIFTGYIKDEEIPALYRNALVYAYPSVYEGFGTPQIEAQSCGCPILCSDIPVFREISGEGAEFCEPVADKIAEKLEYLINTPERREELKRLGYENVKRFSLESVEKQLMGVIDET